MLDLGMKLKKTDEPNKYEVEKICMIFINNDETLAEIVGSDEKEQYPLVDTELDKEVYIFPCQRQLLEIADDESTTLNERIDYLNEAYQGTTLELSAKNEEDLIIDIEKIDVKELSKEIKKSIVGQDEVIDKTISTIIHNQILFETDLEHDEAREQKQTMLIYGGTGTGKTEIVKQIADKINIPCVIEDATKFTDEAYHGRCVSDMLEDLLRAADYDLNVAQRGILIIDEIDKKRASYEAPISTTAVQNSLLKLIDGSVMTVNEDSLYEEPLDFDTSYLTVILVGSFEGMLKNNHKNIIGFNSDSKVEEMKYTTDDFIKFGMIPEFMGRVSNIAKTNDLEYNALRKILVESEISPLNLKKKFLSSLDVKTDFDDEFIDKIVKTAEAKKTGARGLKTAVADAFDELGFNLDFEALSGDLKEIKFEKGKVRKRKAKRK